jgi:hypothetical protein
MSAWSIVVGVSVFVSVELLLSYFLGRKKVDL